MDEVNLLHVARLWLEGRSTADEQPVRQWPRAVRVVWVPLRDGRAYGVEFRDPAAFAGVLGAFAVAACGGPDAVRARAAATTYPDPRPHAGPLRRHRRLRVGRPGPLRLRAGDGRAGEARERAPADDRTERHLRTAVRPAPPGGTARGHALVQLGRRTCSYGRVGGLGPLPRIPPAALTVACHTCSYDRVTAHARGHALVQLGRRVRPATPPYSRPRPAPRAPAPPVRALSRVGGGSSPGRGAAGTLRPARPSVAGGAVAARRRGGLRCGALRVPCDVPATSLRRPGRQAVRPRSSLPGMTLPR